MMKKLISIIFAIGVFLFTIISCEKNITHHENSSNPDVVFVSDRDGNNDIFVMNLNGEFQTNLTKNNNSNSYPSFSDDGKCILFISRIGDQFDILIMNNDGSELKNKYVNYFKNTPNVYVNNSMNVALWIHAAKGIIHYDCTTGMEAVLANKPVISYLPKENPKVNAWLPIAISYQIRDTQSLIKTVNSIFANKFKYNLEVEMKNEWASFINNVNEESNNIITNELLELPNNETIANKKSTEKITLHLIRLKKFLAFLKNRYFTKVHISISKNGTFTKKEIMSKLYRLSTINNYQLEFKLHYQGHDVMRIKNLQKSDIK